MILPSLPGKRAQLLLAPLPRVESLASETAPPAGARESSVLVLLYPTNKGATKEDILKWELLLIVRNHYDGVHSGQVAFPGGKCEEGDKCHFDTASREAMEELGINPDSYSIVGELTHIYVPPSNFTIYPVLAIAAKEVSYTPSGREVMDYMRVPMESFNPGNAITAPVQRTKEDHSLAPGFMVNNHFVWGATAMIIAELYQFISEAMDLSSFKRP